MKKKNAVGLVLGGMLLGVSVMLCLGAAEETKKEPARLQIVTYPAGTTGLFDPDTGKIYLYDINLQNCVQIRQVGSLGDPMKRIKN